MTHGDSQPTDSDVAVSAPVARPPARLLRRLPWLRLAAEFGVIFLGVTLGLLADDWRQSRDEREEEVRALSGLLSDLEADADNLASLGRAMKGYDESAMWIRQRLGEPGVPVDSAALKILAIFNYQNYQAPQAAYAGLRSSGRLVLIRSDELRLRVTEYYEERQPYLARFFASYYEVWMPFRRAVSTDWVLTFPSGRQSYDLRAGGLELQLTGSWEQFPSEPDLVYYLDEVGVLAAVIAGRTADLLDENAQLQALIRRYLAA